ncbi:MAG: serine hydrolase domain-containing protein [Fulvivirga sp.]|uniref:serine hydrolase domain-containing protein n=1 Tax=Fulvivirga sp. TaxID=1931237 RepID=UPI0032ECA27F
MRKITIFMLGLVLSSALHAQYDNVDNETVSRKADSLLESYRFTSKFKGNTLIYREGKIIYEKSIGNSNDDFNIKNTPDTKFRIGSITKTFTAIAILKLVEGKKISLDDDISKYYPSNGNLNGYSIKQLLNHTSGLPRDVIELEENDHNLYTRDEIVNLISSEKLESKPGEKFGYSNIGYYLLGDIIQLASGKSYFDYLNEVILTPLKLSNTVVDDPKMIISNRAVGYDDGPGKDGYAAEVVADFIYPINDLGNGALLSTTQDLLKLYFGLRDNIILPKNLKEEMFNPFENNYGFGLQSVKGQEHMLMHNGNISGFSSSFLFYPGLDVFVVVLCNTNNVDASSVSIAMRNITFGREYYSPKIRKEINIKFDDKIPGKYKNPYFQFELKLEHNKLFVQTPGDPWEELHPESSTLFFSKLHDFNIEFNDNSYKSGTLRFNDNQVEFVAVD